MSKQSETMFRVMEHRCICKHAQTTHLFDGEESVCMHDGCKCNHFHLWDVVFYDPWGGRHEVHDIAKFIRDNPGLFTEEQREQKHVSGSKSGLASVVVNAEVGFSMLITRRAESWHGWTLARLPKTYIEPK